MAVDTLEKLLAGESRDLHSAEKRGTKVLPNLIEAASSEDLKKAFEHHLNEAEAQIQRPEMAFTILGTTPKEKTCDEMKGIQAEGAEMLLETKEGDIHDVALLSAAQRVEHDEMAAHRLV